MTSSSFTSSLIFNNNGAERVVILDANGDPVLTEIFRSVREAVEAAANACHHPRLNPKPWRIEEAPESLCCGLVR